MKAFHVKATLKISQVTLFLKKNLAFFSQLPRACSMFHRLESAACRLRLSAATTQTPSHRTPPLHRLGPAPSAGRLSTARPRHPTTVPCTSTDSTSECLAAGSQNVHTRILAPYSSIFFSNFFHSPALTDPIGRSTRSSETLRSDHRTLHLHRLDFRMSRY